jgi:hypothetical protein
MVAKSDDKFTLHHKEVDGVHSLTFAPAVKNEGFPPKTIELTEGQWNDLKYNFGVGYFGPEDEKLIYVY